MKFTTLLCYFVLVLVLFDECEVVTTTKIRTPSSVLIFGDSTVDPGNNNYIATAFRSNFWPYGKDFVNQMPTGRFSNGRLTSDYIAKYLGVKELVPPYLDPTLTIEDLMTGVSFGSAGSGFDPLTPDISVVPLSLSPKVAEILEQCRFMVKLLTENDVVLRISNVIPMERQLEYLKEYEAKLEVAIGKDKTKEHINNALFLVSAGTNDFVIDYFTLPIRRKSYTIQTYMNFLIQQTRQFLQGLLDQGARRIGVAGLPPMGCLPIVITLYSDDPILERNCVSNFSSVAREYNEILQNELKAMQLESSGSRIAYLDVYGPVEEMALGTQYGFEKVNCGCCGSGMLEASFLCNPKSPVCANATNYVFWDSIHPSERSYQLLVQILRPVIDYLVTE